MHPFAHSHARVFHASRGLYNLITPSGEEISAHLAGSFRNQHPSSADWPVVGDYVQADAGAIRSVAPRSTKFSRRAAGERHEEQVLAANVDLALLVCGLDHDFNLRRLERYLVLTRESGAEAVVVLNKADLAGPSLNGFIAEARSVAGGSPVIPTTTRSADGLDALQSLLEPHTTAVLLGSSGAGKSSITNLLLGDNHLRTQTVREHDSRGRHTTTRRELFRLPGGAWLIDTPGMRELQLWATEESVDDAFDEIAELAARCRFRDCRHNGEPHCAIAKALATGDLSADRWESYQKLTTEVRRMDKATLKKMMKDIRATSRQFRL